MRMVMVGGQTRNIGKTSVIEAIIRQTPELAWTAVKITQLGHGVCSIDGQSCECETGNHSFVITTEKEIESGTDTSRFLAAGAKRSLWIRTRQGELPAALPSIKKAIEDEEFVIVESNSLRRFVTPAIYLQVIQPGINDFKSSAQQFFDLVDAYLLSPQRSDSTPGSHSKVSALLAHQLRQNKPCFSISAADRSVSEEVVSLIRAGLHR